ncbi:MAG TPA: sulfurtransferase TusA family protein [Armatimonadota bacterium]|jgi:TusA-related sulfurtransferase
MTAELNAVVPDSVVDARFVACPGPLLAARRAIDGVGVGQTLEIRSSDAGSQEDIPAWCKKTGQQYLGSLSKDGYRSLFVTRRK